MTTHHFRIRADHPCLPGHFPGQPLVPGVLLLDEVAAALHAAGGGRLARIDTAKFVAPLLPDEDAEVHLQVQPPGWRFRILRGDTLLAEGLVEGVL